MKTTAAAWSPSSALLLPSALMATRHPAISYGIAVGAVVVASAVRWAVGLVEPSIVPFAVFYPAVLIAALAGGLGPGLLATILSAWAASALFMGRSTGFPSLPSWIASVNLALFLAMAMLTILVAASLRSAARARFELMQLFTVVQDLALDGVVIYRAIRAEEGRIVDFERIFMNGAAERVLGSAKLMLGRRYLDTSPTTHRDRLFARYLDVMATGIPAEDEFRFETGNRWIYNVAVRVDADRLAITFRDITTLRETIQQQRFLMRELNHRVKNVLTSVLSLARQTSVEHDATGYREALTARISAMARAHDLLMTESWESARLCDIVAQTLAPYDRIFAQGPPVAVSADLALSINMVLHELATNAVKYGALSVFEGHVEIHWQVEPGDGAISLVWRERGGPAVHPPTRRGFGSRILTRGFNSGRRRARLDFSADGVECTLAFEAHDESRAHGNDQRPHRSMLVAQQ